MSRTRTAIKASAAGLPLALFAVLGVEILVAGGGEYLAANPGYGIDATVGPAASGAPVELAVLGDSTAAGVGSPTEETSLAVLVADRVAARLGRPVHVRGLGVGGARTATVLSEQLPLLAASPPDVVLIVIGSNDVTHVTAPWTFRRQTNALVQAASAQGKPVVIGGIPQFRTVPALAQPLRWVVGRYAAVLRSRQRQAVVRAGGEWVDIAADASPRFIGLPEAMASDGYHPSPIGYGFWADALAPAVAESVRPPGPS